MKADLEYVSRAKTLMQMKIRLEECKTELREIQDNHVRLPYVSALIKDILGVEETK